MLTATATHRQRSFSPTELRQLLGQFKQYPCKLDSTITWLDPGGLSDDDVHCGLSISHHNHHHHPSPPHVNGYKKTSSNSNGTRRLTRNCNSASSLPQQYEEKEVNGEGGDGGNKTRARKKSIIKQPTFELGNGTTGAGKNVQFADMLGMNLAAVKYYIPSPQLFRRHSYAGVRAPKMQEPQPPANLRDDHHPSSLSSPCSSMFMEDAAATVLSANYKDSSQLMGGTGASCEFIPVNFKQPSLEIGFGHRLRQQSVLLHSLTFFQSTIYGIVSVANVEFKKKIYVRYTLNEWRTYREEEASYVQGSSEDGTDKFSFKISIKPWNLTSGQNGGHPPRLIFAIRYEIGESNRQVWDNNQGMNYICNYVNK